MSKASDTVVWELNELLAADRRARAFSEASVAGEYAECSEGFEEAHWQTVGADPDAEEGPIEAEIDPQPVTSLLRERRWRI